MKTRDTILIRAAAIASIVSAFAIIAAVFVIMGDIVAGGAGHITWEFLTGEPTEGMTAGGVFPAIFGTFMLVLIMSIGGIPVGTITAVYLAEYAHQGSRLARLIRFAVTSLAGVPAIVFGLFGLGFFVQFVGTGMDGIFSGEGKLVWGQPNILWASLTMALLTLPVVIVSVEEAIKAVPRELREASLALGATKWQTIRKIVLPNAVTGIMTGGILAVSRGAGEVAPILFTGAAYFLPQLADVALRPVHGTRIPRLHHVHAVARRGSHDGHPVRDHARAADAHLRPEFFGDLPPLQNEKTYIILEPPVNYPLNQQTYKIEARDLNLFYGQKQALKGISMNVERNRVTALIGPSGCGKSTFLRALNRMNDLIDGVRVEGTVTVDGRNIYAPDTDVVELRKNVGMIFQKSNPFPKSIYENVAYGPRINGLRDAKALDEIVEKSLRQAALWEEVKNDLNKSGLSLSGGQQQRLCIARALAVSPEVLLMDEPASALDPMATAKIEELIHELKQQYTIVIVTHNMQQAARVSDKTAFFYIGELIEFNDTDVLFTTPGKKQTEDYITGRFG